MTPALQFRQEEVSLASVSHFTLLIGLGSLQLQIGVVDNQRNECLWLEEYSLIANTEEEYRTKLRQTLAKHELLQKTFWQSVRVVVSNQSFTLLPQPLFQKEFAARSLSLARGLNIDQENVYYTAHETWDAVTVFSIPTPLSDLLYELFPFEKIQIVHQVDQLLSLSTQIPEETVLLYIEKQDAVLVYLRDNQLQYCNRFVYRSSSDIIYYVLFALNELKVDTAQVPAWIFGDITEEEDVYRGLYTYIANLALGLPASVSLATFTSEEIPAHRMAALLQ